MKSIKRHKLSKKFNIPVYVSFEDCGDYTKAVYSFGNDLYVCFACNGSLEEIECMDKHVDLYLENHLKKSKLVLKKGESYKVGTGHYKLWKYLNKAKEN